MNEYVLSCGIIVKHFKSTLKHLLLLSDKMWHRIIRTNKWPHVLVTPYRFCNTVAVWHMNDKTTWIKFEIYSLILQRQASRERPASQTQLCEMSAKRLCRIPLRSVSKCRIDRPALRIFSHTINLTKCCFVVVVIVVVFF